METWRPPTGGCRVLVTSRRSHWSPTLGVTTLPLDLLPRAYSIELLRRYRPDLAPEDPALDAAAAELGDLPLALHLAGSYLRAYRAEVSLDAYLAELHGSTVVQHASLLGAGLDDTPSPTHHVQSLAQTFALWLARLKRDRTADRVAVALLARMASMAPGEPVPLALLRSTMPDVNPLALADGLRRLHAVGLVEEGNGWLRLHRLLVLFVRRQDLDASAQPAVDRALIACGRAAEDRSLTGHALGMVVPHMLNATVGGLGDRRVGDLCGAAGLVLQYANGLDGARPLLERALEARVRVHGPNHVGTAQSLDSLGLLLWNQGDLGASRPLFERALAIRERMLGADHPDTAACLMNLASVLWLQHDLTRARVLVTRALAIRERTLGPDHLDTAKSLGNLARVLQTQGELAAARQADERALAIRERALGPDHPDVAASLNNLGRVLREQGDLAAARDLVERALDIHLRVLGPDHPWTAFNLANLALLLRDQGELTEAQPLFERVLAIREQVLGHDHPDTATSLNDLAALLQAQGNPTAARPLFKRALAIRERVLGPDHPDTVATRRALAELAAEGEGPAAGA